MEQNNESFVSHAENKAGEFSLEAKRIHEQFIELVELHLENSLEGIGLNVNEFMNLCSHYSSNHSRNEGVQAFLELILGCTDFMVFGDIISDVNKRQYYFQMINMWRRTLVPSSHHK